MDTTTVTFSAAFFVEKHDVLYNFLYTEKQTKVRLFTVEIQFFTVARYNFKFLCKVHFKCISATIIALHLNCIYLHSRHDIFTPLKVLPEHSSLSS
jgi:hypothetical protein